MYSACAEFGWAALEVAGLAGAVCPVAGGPNAFSPNAMAMTSAIGGNALRTPVITFVTYALRLPVL